MDEITFKFLLDIGFGALIAFIVLRAMGNQTDALEKQTNALVAITSLAAAIEGNNKTLAIEVRTMASSILENRENSFQARERMQVVANELPDKILGPILDKIDELRAVCEAHINENSGHYQKLAVGLAELKEILQDGN